MPRFGRILLKLSGEMLAGPTRFGLDDSAVSRVAAEIKSGLDAGVGIGVVVGAGNLLRGAGPNQSPINILQQRKDSMGMLATAINATALQDKLEALGIETMHVSSLAGIPLTRPYDVREVDTLLARSGVVLFSGGTGLPVLSTETGAAIRALQIGADALFKGTQVDGVYDKAPRKADGGPPARHIPTLTHSFALENRLQFKDLAAIAVCAQHKLTMVVFNEHAPGNLRTVLDEGLPCSRVEH